METRNRAVALLEMAVRKRTDLTVHEHDRASFVKNCERAVLNWTIEQCKELPTFLIPAFYDMYRDKIIMLYWNFQFRKTYFLEKALQRTLPLSEMVKWTHYDILPPQVEPIQLETTKQDPVRGTIKCRRCGSDKTEYTLVQTRSADEGSTVFLYCNNCGKRAKFGG